MFSNSFKRLFFLIICFLIKFAWSEPIEQARAGYVNVKVYDEEAFLALKKVQRGQGGDASKIKPVQTISFYHYVSFFIIIIRIFVVEILN